MHRYRGTISILTPEFDRIEYPIDLPQSALESQKGITRHITLYTAEETKQVLADILLTEAADIGQVFHLGLGLANGVYFEVISIPSAQKIRTERFSLPWKDYHITLGSIVGVDDHSADKGPLSLVYRSRIDDDRAKVMLDCLLENWRVLHASKPALPALLDFSLQLVQVALSSELSPLYRRRLLTHRALMYFCQQRYQESYTDCIESVLCDDTLDDIDTSLVRLGDVCRKLPLLDLALAAYWKARIVSVDDRVVRYTNKQLLALWKQSVCSLELRSDVAQIIKFTDVEMQRYRTLRYTIIQPGEAFEPCEIEPRVHAKLVGGTSLKRNFSWVVPLFLAGMSTPKSAEDITALHSIGIHTVLTLTEEEPLPASWFPPALGVTNVFWPVANYFPPVAAHADRFIHMVIQAIHGSHGETRAVLVHCGGGKGRAGSLLAAYLLLFGLSSPPKPCGLCRRRPAICCSDSACAYGQSPVMTPSDAIALIRRIRPGSIETSHQEAFISAYSSLCFKRLGKGERITQLIDDSDDTIGEVRLIEGDIKVRPSFIMLMGLPGSGKSWFAEQMATTASWVRICQDEEGGSRKGFETALSNAWRANKNVVLDRANVLHADRVRWLDMVGRPENAVLVHFDASARTCIERAEQRLDHPTLQPHAASNVIESFHKSFESPSLASTKVAAIYRVSSFADSRQLLRHFGVRLRDPEDVSTTFYKYPRTRHLYNIGGAGRDDLLLTTDEAEAFLRPSIQITIEEKVDGANFGIRFNINTQEFQCQNRSHFVCPTSHVQFSRINAFINKHRASLYELLCGGDLILYGEWLAAQHSVSYNQLPDYFLAFDIFDCISGKFYSRSRYYAIMAHTSIQSVQCIYNGIAGENITKNMLLNMIHEPSLYSNASIREGVVVRVDDAEGQWLVDKAKVVRGDFIAGNEHWSKGIITLNRLVGSA